MQALTNSQRTALQQRAACPALQRTTLRVRCSASSSDDAGKECFALHMLMLALDDLRWGSITGR